MGHISKLQFFSKIKNGQKVSTTLYQVDREGLIEIYSFVEEDSEHYPKENG
jgi:hypothetical protein